MKNNLTVRSKEERDKVNVDLADSGMAYKERLNQPVIPQQVKMEQPEELGVYFRERLQHYRQLALQLPKDTDTVYLKEDKS
ncbi:DNA polymerase III subunit theta [Cronobacter dublinensis]|uniref:DNA polymerase III subunit theta n=1 Tax=Cronobacter dublinensis TaxID=413497 RepID=UPI002991546B|nr:DNA polymerase III subunit theta [Cronobacter muytjensii]HAV6909334.1 DNA polymerase III subunit theta [Cronobacter sakazakii]HDK7276982.1 DNA polymerase III subunit theta [Cronobacter sakazakii]